MVKLTVLVSPSVVVNVPASVIPNDQFQMIEADAGVATPNVATRVRTAARDFLADRDRRVTGLLLRVEPVLSPYCRRLRCRTAIPAQPSASSVSDIGSGTVVGGGGGGGGGGASGRGVSGLSVKAPAARVV